VLEHLEISHKPFIGDLDVKLQEILDEISP